MTFENIRRILLPKEDGKASELPLQQGAVLTNPDETRTRRNKLAAIITHSQPLKKVA